MTYNYRSAPLTAGIALGEGTYSYSVTPVAGRTRTFAVEVDNSAPAGADVQTANGGAVAGLPEEHDSVTFTFSEPIDAHSVLAGWEGSPTDVLVR